MDENTYINLIRAQLAALGASAAEDLGEDHTVTVALAEALERVGGEAYVPAAERVPAGFADREAYDAFIQEQAENLEERYGERIQFGGVAEVVGTIVAEDGTYTEVGNLDAAVAQANAAVRAAEVAYDEDEEGEYVAINEPIETDNEITVAYTRLNGQPLDDTQVRSIINHPASAALKHLGNLVLVGINPTEQVNKREAVFAVIEDGKIDLKALAINAVRYQGVQVFPGLGQVQAVGTVNFA